MTKRHDNSPGVAYSVDYIQEPHIEGGRVVLADQPPSGTTVVVAGAAASLAAGFEVGR
jgi:hypothetical protein